MRVNICMVQHHVNLYIINYIIFSMSSRKCPCFSEQFKDCSCSSKWDVCEVLRKSQQTLWNNLDICINYSANTVCSFSKSQCFVLSVWRGYRVFTGTWHSTVLYHQQVKHFGDRLLNFGSQLGSFCRRKDSLARTGKQPMPCESHNKDPLSTSSSSEGSNDKDPTKSVNSKTFDYNSYRLATSILKG